MQGFLISRRSNHKHLIQVVYGTLTIGSELEAYAGRINRLAEVISAAGLLNIQIHVDLVHIYCEI